MGNATQDQHKFAEQLRRQAIERLNSDVTSQHEEPALKASADDGLLVMLKIVSAGFGGFCLFVALRITADLFAEPNVHDAFVLGLFLAMAGMGFLIWTPQKYQRRYVAVLSLFIAILELTVNVAIIMKSSS